MDVACFSGDLGLLSSFRLRGIYTRLVRTYTVYMLVHTKLDIDVFCFLRVDVGFRDLSIILDFQSFSAACSFHPSWEQSTCISRSTYPRGSGETKSVTTLTGNVKTV